MTMSDRLHVPRSRGAASGALLVLLGVWGGLVPFVGPEFGYSFTPDVSWHYTTGRLLLEIIPAAATILGGLALMGSASRISGSVGAWLAIAGGAWFVMGQWFSMLWNNGTMQAGNPTATSNLGVVVEWVGFFLGLGVVIVFLGSFALGRMSVVGVREARLAEERMAAREDDARMGDEPMTDERMGHDRMDDERMGDERASDDAVGRRRAAPDETEHP
jgi:hypothetical protein